MSEFTTLPARRMGEPTVGRPALWARDLALVGALMPASALLSQTLGFAFSLEAALHLLPVVLPQSLTAALLGGLVGATLGRALEGMRGQVPLSLLWLGASTSAAVWGMATIWIATGTHAIAAARLTHALWWGGLLGMIAPLYLVARVLRLPTAPLLGIVLVLAGPIHALVSQALIWLSLL